MRESKIKPAGTASLNYEGKDYELPVFAGTQGPNVVDIRKLYDQADIFTYDPGFTSTASTRKQHHLHRWRQGRAAISRLSHRPSWRSIPASWRVCYLLLYGELPNKSADGGIRPHHHPPHHGA